MSEPLFNEHGRPSLSSRLDVYAFFSAFVVGLASYLLLHLTVRTQLFETLAIVICMFAYAIVVVRVPRLRVRLDQAGDNAYYLGLLFTLTSMAFALYEFRSASLTDAGVSGRAGAEQIIANFGIALASTICGIFLRVVLHQMRIDPADIEGMTRIELAEASRRVKVNLDAVSTDLVLFQAQAAQRMNDVISNASVEFLTAFNAFTDKVNAVEPLPQALAQRLQEVCGQLEQLTAAVRAATASAEAAARETQERRS
jgi:hypothetical protein